MTTSYNGLFSIGNILYGKWNKKQYRIERKLGEGANGMVYLVTSGLFQFALKVGFDPVDLQIEINVLRSLRSHLGSSDRFLIDVDDCSFQGKQYSFYVMKYVKGLHAHEYIQEKGIDWIYPIGQTLLKRLDKLHRFGWVFGDLKPENIMVSDYGNVELIDYGGVTQMGRSVRQFTEIFDRGYWNLGSRVADEKYDLFAFAVLCLYFAGANSKLLEASHVLPQNRNEDFLLQLIHTTSSCKKIAPVLEKAIVGRYATVREALNDWRSYTIAERPISRQQIATQWIKAAFVASIALCGSAIYYFWQ